MDQTHENQSILSDFHPPPPPPLQSAATEWWSPSPDAPSSAVRCPPRPGSCCGRSALPFRPWCTAASATRAAQSPTRFKTGRSSPYSSSCSTTRHRTEPARWTEDKGTRLEDGSVCLDFAQVFIIICFVKAGEGCDGYMRRHPG